MNCSLKIPSKFRLIETVESGEVSAISDKFENCSGFAIASILGTFDKLFPQIQGGPNATDFYQNFAKIFVEIFGTPWIQGFNADDAKRVRPDLTVLPGNRSTGRKLMDAISPDG